MSRNNDWTDEGLSGREFEEALFGKDSYRDTRRPCPVCSGLVSLSQLTVLGPDYKSNIRYVDDVRSNMTQEEYVRFKNGVCPLCRGTGEGVWPGTLCTYGLCRKCAQPTYGRSDFCSRCNCESGSSYIQKTQRATAQQTYSFRLPSGRIVKITGASSEAEAHRYVIERLNRGLL